MSTPWIDPALPVGHLTDAQVVIVTAYGEVRSDPLEGIVAMLCSVRNRVAAQHRGRTFREVCLSPWQYSCWNPAGGQRNYERVVALITRMAGGETLTEPSLRELAYLAHGVMKDMVRDTVKGATHYHTATLQPRPKWAQDVVPVCQKGSHVFYAGVQ